MEGVDNRIYEDTRDTERKKKVKDDRETLMSFVHCLGESQLGSSEYTQIRRCFRHIYKKYTRHA